MSPPCCVRIFSLTPFELLEDMVCIILLLRAVYFCFLCAKEPSPDWRHNTGQIRQTTWRSSTLVTITDTAGESSRKRRVYERMVSPLPLRWTVGEVYTGERKRESMKGKREVVFGMKWSNDTIFVSMCPLSPRSKQRRWIGGEVPSHPCFCAVCTP